MHISITYRGDENRGGVLFDHFVMTSIIQEYERNWQVTLDEKKITTKIAHRYKTPEFGKFFKEIKSRGEYGLSQHTLPETIRDTQDSLFIFIPGYTRKSENDQNESHKNRLEFEKKLIKQARYRGQPVLAVCAGSWTLWETYGGKLKDDIREHCSRKMPTLVDKFNKDKKKYKVGHNTLVHNVSLAPNTFLYDAVASDSQKNGNTHKKQEAFPVNSVHWKAVDDSQTAVVPELLRISARSMNDDNIAPYSSNKDKKGLKMNPSTCVEAFETKFGVPMIGVQWHPEAFDPRKEGSKPHMAIFTYMIETGKTYLNRRKLNEDFLKHVSNNKASFFAYEDTAEESTKSSSIAPSIKPNVK
ncbi:MAG: gamma-glutamyl-gamma-aminobutyrate hydrolase family protein [Legionellaceae bacterium]|nr:gamma-glutamyl-gamma-aminobutyrate hydrolase family protein [Legionellaceae bacterium]